jgi:hypothetical protein
MITYTTMPSCTRELDWPPIGGPVNSNAGALKTRGQPGMGRGCIGLNKQSVRALKSCQVRKNVLIVFGEENYLYCLHSRSWSGGRAGRAHAGHPGA